jgi:DNA end-binding protein Ku
VLETMLWPDEIRTPEFEVLATDVEVRPAEVAMAQSLIKALAADWDPDEFSDQYREAVQQLIDAKVEGREVVAPAASDEGDGAVVDLMAALRASVDAAKAARSERTA